MGAISVSHLEWRLPSGDELLDDISFTIGNGDRVALVGANGVGKTTLLRLITGELTPTAGTISIDGQLGVMSTNSSAPPNTPHQPSANSCCQSLRPDCAERQPSSLPPRPHSQPTTA